MLQNIQKENSFDVYLFTRNSPCCKGSKANDQPAQVPNMRNYLRCIEGCCSTEIGNTKRENSNIQNFYVSWSQTYVSNLDAFEQESTFMPAKSIFYYRNFLFSMVEMLNAGVVLLPLIETRWFQKQVLECLLDKKDYKISNYGKDIVEEEKKKFLKSFINGATANCTVNVTDCSVTSTSESYKNMDCWNIADRVDLKEYKIYTPSISKWRNAVRVCLTISKQDLGSPLSSSGRNDFKIH